MRREERTRLNNLRKTDSTDKKQEGKKMEKKLGKFERDQQTVDAILAKGTENLTHFDRIALLAVYQTSYHDSGKIEGVTSCDSSCHGCTFCEKMRKAAESDPSIICGECYDAKQEDYRTSVKNRHMLNLRIMSSVLFEVEELAILPTTAITRINSSGDIENVTHAQNMIRFAKAHPHSKVAIWAKNYDTVTKAFDLEGKPENVLYIASSYRIDKPVTLPQWADNTFTVYSTPEKVLDALEAGAGECNGKKCRECGYKCYLGGWTHGQDIAELLRK